MTESTKKTVTMVLDIDKEINKEFKKLCKENRLGFVRDVAIKLLEDAMIKYIKKGS